MSTPDIARVIQVHRERYILSFDKQVLNADLTGKFMFDHESAEDYPAVGDWVEISRFDSDQAIIHSVKERRTVLRRKAINKLSESQLIAANIDLAFIVTAVDRDFNLHRIDRYLTLVNDGGIEPLIILNKIDLIDANELEELEKQIHQRHPKLKLLSISGLQETAVPRILAQMEKDKIYCFIGSSGVGKSTIINQLLNDVHFKTQSISDSNAKGKHTTTHRELIELENGSIVIDTPGMKEIGISANESALSDTFSDITNLAASCRFTNCSHKHEPGCAIREAIQSGDLDEDKFSNYQKLQRETERFQLDKREKHLKDKQQGKLYKSIQNANRKLKY